MAKKLSIRFAVIVLSLSVFTGLSFADLDLEISAPVLNEGDFWHFKVTIQPATSLAGESSSRARLENGTYVVRFTGGKLLVRQLTADGEQQVRGAQSLLTMVGQNISARDGVNPTVLRAEDLRFPLFAGKQWTYTYKPDVHSSSRVVHIEVVGVGPINTAFGITEALKLAKTVTVPRDSASRGVGREYVQSIFFYSPEPKSVVKFSSSREDGSSREIDLIKWRINNGRVTKPFVKQWLCGETGQTELN